MEQLANLQGASPGNQSCETTDPWHRLGLSPNLEQRVVHRLAHHAKAAFGGLRCDFGSDRLSHLLTCADFWGPLLREVGKRGYGNIELTPRKLLGIFDESAATDVEGWRCTCGSSRLLLTCTKL